MTSNGNGVWVHLHLTESGRRVTTNIVKRDIYRAYFFKITQRKKKNSTCIIEKRKISESYFLLRLPNEIVLNLIFI